MTGFYVKCNTGLKWVNEKSLKLTKILFEIISSCLCYFKNKEKTLSDCFIRFLGA